VAGAPQEVREKLTGIGVIIDNETFHRRLRGAKCVKRLG
jgi:hypothetical protein